MITIVNELKNWLYKSYLAAPVPYFIRFFLAYIYYRVLKLSVPGDPFRLPKRNSLDRLLADVAEFNQSLGYICDFTPDLLSVSFVFSDDISFGSKKHLLMVLNYLEKQGVKINLFSLKDNRINSVDVIESTWGPSFQAKSSISVSGMNSKYIQWIVNRSRMCIIYHGESVLQYLDRRFTDKVYLLSFNFNRAHCSFARSGMVNLITDSFHVRQEYLVGGVREHEVNVLRQPAIYRNVGIPSILQRFKYYPLSTKLLHVSRSGKNIEDFVKGVLAAHEIDIIEVVDWDVSMAGKMKGPRSVNTEAELGGGEAVSEVMGCLYLSKIDGRPNVLLEASELGLPLVSYGSDAVKEIMGSCFVDIDTINAGIPLVERLDQLIDSKVNNDNLVEEFELQCRKIFLC